MRMSTRAATLAVLLSLVSTAPALAQTTTNAPDAVDIFILPAVGDPVTVAPIANGTVHYAVSPTSPFCNQAALPPGAVPLINPTVVEMTDPFTVGRVCKFLLPVSLANGSGYRVVAVYTNATGASPRSAVGTPPFAVSPILALPAAPTGLAVK